MTNPNPKFSPATNVYLGIITLFIIFLPIEYEYVRSKSTNVPASNWLIAAFIVLAIILLLFYANKRCTGEKLSYIQGFQFVASFMRGAGLLYITWILIFLCIGVLIPSSIAISIYGDITRKNSFTPNRYHKLVSLFHKHRMRQ